MSSLAPALPCPSPERSSRRPRNKACPARPGPGTRCRYQRWGRQPAAPRPQIETAAGPRVLQGPCHWGQRSAQDRCYMDRVMLGRIYMGRVIYAGKFLLERDLGERPTCLIVHRVVVQQGRKADPYRLRTAVRCNKCQQIGSYPKSEKQSDRPRQCGSYFKHQPYYLSSSTRRRCR